MSDNANPDSGSFRYLELLVRNLGEELAMFRRRALQAEARLRHLESTPKTSSLFTEAQGLALQAENADLRTRMEQAAERTRALLEQVRFLRQQQEHAAVVVAGGDR